MIEIINKEINSHNELSNKLSTLANSIESASNLAIQSLKSKGKIILFGNGGSASDAQHIAAELVGRYKKIEMLYLLLHLLLTRRQLLQYQTTLAMIWFSKGSLKHFLTRMTL